jgi:hypothetical protein
VLVELSSAQLRFATEDGWDNVSATWCRNKTWGDRPPIASSSPGRFGARFRDDLPIYKAFAGRSGARESLTKTFAEVASTFCAWAEKPAAAPDAEVASARRLLSELYRLALDLPPAQDCATPASQSKRAEWKAVYKRFGALPFNYYALVDPHVLPAADFMTGDLADDLTDIWSDLKAGVALHEAGRADEALHEWRWRFDCHWAKHAAEALHALQSWVSQRAGERADAAVEHRAGNGSRDARS